MPVPCVQFPVAFNERLSLRRFTTHIARVALEDANK